MRKNKHILILLLLVGGLLACGSPPEPQLATRDAEVSIDMAIRGGDMSVTDSGIQSADDMALPDATPLQDMGIETDAQSPSIETGRIQCGELTYSSLSIRSGDIESGWLYRGTTERASGYSGSCGGLGSDALIKFTAPEAGVYTLVLTTSTGSSPVLYVRATCELEASEAACAEGLAQLGGATVTIEATPDSEWYVFVDTWQPSLPVDFQLEIFHANEHQAPVVESASLSTDTGDLRFKIQAEDVNANVVSGILESADPSVSAAYPFTFERRATEGSLRYAEFNFGSMSTVPSAWQVTVTDQTGLDSDTVMVNVYTTQTGPLESDCGLSTPEIINCVAGSVCTQAPNGASTCTESLPPQISEFTVFQTPMGHTARARVVDPNLDIAFGLVELTDAEGNRLERHIFPIDQVEPSTTLVFKLPRQDPTTASIARLTLTDEMGYETSVSDISIEAPALLTRGSACTPYGFEQRCASQDICLKGCETDRVECDARCILRSRPLVESASLIKNDPRNRLTLTVFIEDPQRIFADVVVHPLGNSTSPIQFNFNGWRRVADTVYTSEASVNLFDDFRTLTALVVTPMDEDGLMGEPFQVDVQPPAEIEANAPCDPLDATRLCMGGQACFATQEGNFSCGISQAPSIEEVTLYTTPELAYAGIRALGTTGDASARTILIRTVQTDGQASQFISVPIAVPINAQSTLDLAQRIPSLPENVDLEMALQDNRYLQSEWKLMNRITAGLIENGEGCQEDIVFGRCAGNTDCLPTDTGDRTCQTIASTCPVEWQVESLNEASESTVFSGDTREGYTSHTGSCNFGGQAVIHGFVPDTDQLYVARAVPVSPNPIRYPRLALFETCGQAQSELSCSQNATLAFEGRADITAYIAISAPPLGSDFPGTYDLEIAPHRPAQIRSISLVEPVILSMTDLTIAFDAGTETVTSISLRILDALGAPIWSPTYGETWTQSLVPSESDDGATAVSRLDLSSFDSEVIHRIEVRLIDALDVYSAAQSVVIP